MYTSSRPVPNCCADRVGDVQQQRHRELGRVERVELRRRLPGAGDRDHLHVRAAGVLELRPRFLARGRYAARAEPTWAEPRSAGCPAISAQTHTSTTTSTTTSATATAATRREDAVTFPPIGFGHGFRVLLAWAGICARRPLLAESFGRDANVVGGRGVDIRDRAAPSSSCDHRGRRCAPTAARSPTPPGRSAWPRGPDTRRSRWTARAGRSTVSRPPRSARRDSRVVEPVTTSAFDWLARLPGPRVARHWPAPCAVVGLGRRQADGGHHVVAGAAGQHAGAKLPRATLPTIRKAGAEPTLRHTDRCTSPRYRLRPWGP